MVSVNERARSHRVHFATRAGQQARGLLREKIRAMHHSVASGPPQNPPNAHPSRWELHAFKYAEVSGQIAMQTLFAVLPETTASSSLQ